jgi:hypothetical protein
VPVGLIPLRCRATAELLNRTGYVREHIIGIRANQPNGADNDYQNDGEHHGVFRNVLAFVVTPEFVQMVHMLPPDKDA